jgi:predicted metal-dependent hydrolase
MDIYQKGDQAIHYVIIHKKIKNTYFRVKENYVLITTSMYTSKKQILSFLDERFDKFYHIILKQHHQDKDHQLTLWGKTYEIILDHGRFSYEIFGNQITITTTKNDIKQIKRLIYHNEMIKQIKDIHPEVIKVIKDWGLYAVPIKLKYLKSKFGSYHRKHREITLNTFLATLPTIYLTYVLYHEYAHAIVFNHSKDFYNLLGEWMPNHRIYQKDLKKIAII